MSYAFKKLLDIMNLKNQTFNKIFCLLLKIVYDFLTSIVLLRTQLPKQITAGYE